MAFLPLFGQGGQQAVPLWLHRHPPASFATNEPRASPDYGIIKFGNPDDHVIAAHGFIDGAASCEDVLEALNTNACKETDRKQCLNPYSCITLNE